MSTILRRLLTVILSLGLMLSTAAGASGEEFTSPLFGLDVAPNGDLLVADSGIGIHVYSDGAIESTISLPLVTDVSALGVGSMWATTTGDDPEENSGQAIWPGLRRLAQLFVLYIQKIE